VQFKTSVFRQEAGRQNILDRKVSRRNTHRSWQLIPKYTSIKVSRAVWVVFS